MKHYVGDRTIDGVKVTVDGAPLDPCMNVMEFTKNGFEWSYEGPEPRQLALALLVDHLGDKDGAKAAVEPFMQAVVANFGNEWEMTSADLDGAGRPCRQGGRLMPLQYRAAVLHAAQTPMSIETVTAGTSNRPTCWCGCARPAFAIPISKSSKARCAIRCRSCSGTRPPASSSRSARQARGVKVGDHVVLSWNPHCGHCFYCDRDLPILCEKYLGKGPKAGAFDGESRARLADGRELQQLMFLGAFGEYCVVPDQQAIAVPKEIPFDRACLIGCGVMTGVGAALNLGAIAHRRYRDGDRLRRGGPGGGAGRAAGGRRRDHRGRSRSGETCARREDGRDPWRRCLEGRRDRGRQNERPAAAASMS